MVEAGTTITVWHDECDPQPRRLTQRSQRHVKLVTVIAQTALAAHALPLRVARKEKLSVAEGFFSQALTVSPSLSTAWTAATATTAYDLLEVYGLRHKVQKYHNLLELHQLDGEDLISIFQPMAIIRRSASGRSSLSDRTACFPMCEQPLEESTGTAFFELMTRLSCAFWWELACLQVELGQTENTEGKDQCEQ